MAVCYSEFERRKSILELRFDILIPLDVTDSIRRAFDSLSVAILSISTIVERNLCTFSHFPLWHIIKLILLEFEIIDRIRSGSKMHGRYLSKYRFLLLVVR